MLWQPLHEIGLSPGDNRKRDLFYTLRIFIPIWSQSKILSNLSPGIIAVIIKTDSTKKMIKNVYPTESGEHVTLSDGDARAMVWLVLLV